MDKQDGKNVQSEQMIIKIIDEKGKVKEVICRGGVMMTL